MYPGLSHGAYECLHEHGTPEQKATVSAEAGVGRMDRHHVPDRSALRHRPGHAALEGRAAGRRLLQDHRQQDFHLGRRARHGGEHPAPGAGAPAGCAGRHARASRCSSCRSSCRMPMARWARATRSSAARSKKRWASTATATCQMNLDGATGWLIGEPNKGLNAMFVMMNAARLGVGMQSLGLTEVAYQNALIYAKDRLQMRSLTGAKAPDKPADPIIVHPDVRRMLLTRKAYAEGGRAFSSYVALQIDRELNHPDEDSAQGSRR